MHVASITIKVLLQDGREIEAQVGPDLRVDHYGGKLLAIHWSQPATQTYWPGLQYLNFDEVISITSEPNFEDDDPAPEEVGPPQETQPTDPAGEEVEPPPPAGREDDHEATAAAAVQEAAGYLEQIRRERE